MIANASDVRDFSLSCKHLNDTTVVSCDYRYSSKYDIKDVSLKLNNNPAPIQENSLKAYPLDDQLSSVLVMVDTSDPKRKETIEKKNRQVLLEIIEQLKANQKLGIASFDSEINILTPITSDKSALRVGAKELNASGLSTEFYKSILSGIDVLKKTDSSRKGLIIMSDGKDEDRAYRREDVLLAAKEANISILSIGFLEKANESPYLQTLEKLSNDTFGQYINGTELKFPDKFKKNPFSFIENGGSFQVSSINLYGLIKVEISLGLTNGGTLTLVDQIDIPDGRTYFNKFYDLILENPIWASISLFLSLIFFYLFYLLYRKKFNATIFAYLKETDGNKTVYEIKKSPLRIGRNSENDIVLSNDSVSLFHAELSKRRDGAFYIVDLSSTNGTFINDNKINQSNINDGDLIEIGEVRLYFFYNRLEN